MDYQDPLASYVPISRHPSSDPSSDELPSPANPDEWRTLRKKVNVILDNYIPLEDKDCPPLESKDDTPKVFRAFIQYLCEEGRTTLMKEIIHCAPDPAKLRMLRNFLLDAILKPMVIAGGNEPEPLTPTPTEIQPSIRRDQAKLKKDCASRDNNQCIFTSIFDEDCFDELPVHRRRQLKCGFVECAHILPFALGMLNENNAFEANNKATIWWALYQYFPFIRDKIRPETINQPGNAITLWSDARWAFGKFRLAAEPLKMAHKYRSHIQSANTFLSSLTPATITMKQSGHSIPMPNSEFLKAHFQISMILQVSGIGKKIQDALRENEDISICNIQPDGSTDLGNILSRKLLIIPGL